VIYFFGGPADESEPVSDNRGGGSFKLSFLTVVLDLTNVSELTEFFDDLFKGIPLRDEELETTDDVYFF
jgi:hypothetical protein